MSCFSHSTVLHFATYFIKQSFICNEVFIAPVKTVVLEQANACLYM